MKFSWHKIWMYSMIFITGIGVAFVAQADIPVRDTFNGLLEIKNREKIVFQVKWLGIKFMNKAGQKLMGYDPKEVIGKSMTDLEDLMPKDEMQDMMGMMDKLLKTGKLETEIPMTSKDGKTSIIQSSSSVLKDKNGEMLGFVSTSRDVTAIRNSIKEQEETKKYLERQVKQLLEVTNAVAILIHCYLGNTSIANILCS